MFLVRMQNQGGNYTRTMREQSLPLVITRALIFLQDLNPSGFFSFLIRNRRDIIHPESQKYVVVVKTQLIRPL